MTKQDNTAMRQELGRLFFAGRASMELEIETKGRSIQFPINEQIKPAMQLIQQHTEAVVLEAVDKFHERIFNHFDLLPKIQDKGGSVYNLDFNPQNYQAVACDYIRELKEAKL